MTFMVFSTNIMISIPKNQKKKMDGVLSEKKRGRVGWNLSASTTTVRQKVICSHYDSVVK